MSAVRLENIKVVVLLFSTTVSPCVFSPLSADTPRFLFNGTCQPGVQLRVVRHYQREHMGNIYLVLYDTHGQYRPKQLYNYRVHRVYYTTYRFTIVACGNFLRNRNWSQAVGSTKNLGILCI